MQKSVHKEIKFGEEAEKRFQDILAKYPTRDAALLPTLWLAQEEFGALPDSVLEYVAHRLSLSPVRVFAVSRFYTMFHSEPAARYHLQLCRNLSCSLLGSEELQAFLEKEIGLRPGGKTSDGSFSLELVECLGSCGTAPVMRVNDTYFENLDVEKVKKIISGCLEGRLPEPDSL